VGAPIRNASRPRPGGDDHPKVEPVPTLPTLLAVAGIGIGHAILPDHRAAVVSARPRSPGSPALPPPSPAASTSWPS
jgi:hypothetical protein